MDVVVVIIVHGQFYVNLKPVSLIIIFYMVQIPRVKETIQFQRLEYCFLQSMQSTIQQTCSTIYQDTVLIDLTTCGHIAFSRYFAIH